MDKDKKAKKEKKIKKVKNKEKKENEVNLKNLKNSENKIEKIITFDTNAIMYAVQKRIDLLEELKNLMIQENINGKIVVPSGIYKELDKIKTKKTSIIDSINAGIAQQMLNKWENEGKIKIEKAEPPLDRWFISTAKKQKIVILTYDRELKKKLQDIGVKIISLRR